MSQSIGIAKPPARLSPPTLLVGRWSAAGALPSWWPLALILPLQAIVSLITLHNSAFQDEGLYLYAGRQILQQWMGGPPLVEQYAFYFSGYPYVYPVIGGALDIVGGLELARAFSLACMLGVTAIVYVSARRLFDAPSAALGTAAYGFLGTVLFVGRLATYDALCLFLITVSISISLRIGAGRQLWPALTLGPLLVLATLTKYAAMLFIPSALGLLVAGCIAFQGWRRMAPRLAVALASLGISVALAVAFMNPAAFHAIAGTTTARGVGLEASRLELIKHVLNMGGVVYALGLLGLALVFRRRPQIRVVAAILFGSSLLMPAYHIYKQEPVSLDKHIAYGLFFVAPLAGYGIAWLAGDAHRLVPKSRVNYGLPGLAAVLIVFILGLQQSQWVYSSWANSSALSNVLHTQLRDGTGRFFAEDIEVARYDARDISQAWQWNGPYYFSYETERRQVLFGDPALTQALHDRYFAIVELSFISRPNTAFYIAEQMAESRNYDLIARIPFRNAYGTGYFYIWRSALVAGGGNYTSLAQLGI